MVADATIECQSQDSTALDESTADAYADKNKSCGFPQTHEHDDSFAISWDGPDDGQNPMNWTQWKKTYMVLLVSAIGFSTPFASSVAAPATSEILQSFNSDSAALGGFVTSIYVLGTAIGPLLLAPSSEIWGRLPVIHASNVAFVAFTLGCALANSFASLFVFRFLAGCAGAAPLTVGGGVIADTIPTNKRGKYVSVFALGGMIGPVLGPVVGGFAGQYLGWEWTFWITLIIGVFLTLLCVVFLRESFAPVLLKAKARKYCKANGVSDVKIEGVTIQPTWDIFMGAFARPLKILLGSPIAFFLSLYQALQWGYVYLLFTTFPAVFGSQYGWPIGISGLSYLGIGIGNVAAMVISARLSDRLNVSYASRKGKSLQPEGRLILMIMSAPLVPVGFFWYGWSAQAQVHWIVPILGNVVLGVGILASMMPTNIYMIDAFTKFAASALAAGFFMRSVFGGLLPLAGGPMFNRLGVGWGASVLGFIALVMCIIPVLFFYYGAFLRNRFPVKL